jgi:hypothetical protein
MAKAIDKLKTHSTLVAAKMGMTVRNVLAVTNPLGKSKAGQTVAAYADKNGVLLWDRDYLIDNVWPDSLKGWAKSVHAKAYYRM